MDDNEPAADTITVYADDYDRLEVLDRIEVLIARGTVIDGAVIALCPAADGTVTADVCIDGPPVP